MGRRGGEGRGKEGETKGERRGGQKKKEPQYLRANGRKRERERERDEYIETEGEK